MLVKLLKHTPDPIRAVAVAAKLCYSPVGIKDISEGISDEEAEKFVRMLVRMGHETPTEHAVFTFGIEGISRVTTHQLVRHRLASYSQQSQRYVTMENFECIVPPSIAENGKFKALFDETISTITEAYDGLIAAGVEPEDARYLLPNACETKIVMTMNARELHHFFKLRCCNRAQWEIHDLADAILKEVKAVAPALFVNAGPECVRDKCKEGSMTCGKAEEVREKYKG